MKTRVGELNTSHIGRIVIVKGDAHRPAQSGILTQVTHQESGPTRVTTNHIGLTKVVNYAPDETCDVKR